MSALSVRLPESLHKAVRAMAKKERVSINQLIASAVGEKLAVLMTEEYLNQRAKRGSRRNFEYIMNRVPDVEADDEDKL
jgi:hypothetical protein